MKYDIYYKKVQDEEYEELLKRSRGYGSESNWVNSLSEEQVENLLDKYEYYSCYTANNPEMMADFIFSLHYKDDYSITRKQLYKTKIYPHIEAKQLVMNIQTHETRIVESVDYDSISLYNTDRDPSSQEWGYIRRIKEKWNRVDCIPLNMNNVDTNYFCYGTELGTHKKYDEIAYQDMCEW